MLFYLTVTVTQIVLDNVLYYIWTIRVHRLKRPSNIPTIFEHSRKHCTYYEVIYLLFVSVLVWCVAINLILAEKNIKKKQAKCILSECTRHMQLNSCHFRLHYGLLASVTRWKLSCKTGLLETSWQINKNTTQSVCSKSIKRRKTRKWRNVNLYVCNWLEMESIVTKSSIIWTFQQVWNLSFRPSSACDILFAECIFSDVMYVVPLVTLCMLYL